MENLTRIPSSFIAGDSLAWLLSYADYPADGGWVLSIVLVKDGAKITIPSTASGSQHQVSIPSATTAAYAPGTYHFQASVTSGTDRVTVGSGSIEIKPDFASQTTGYDARTWLDKAIEALEASIAGRASKTQLAQTIGGVQVQHIPPGDQLSLLDKLRAQRQRQEAVERRTAGLGSRSIIKVRF
jgi:hypothetical protein